MYHAVREMICTEFKDVNISVKRTQINFSNKYNFAFVWLPVFKKMKGRCGVYIIFTFGLGYRLKSPRIIEAVEPYPGRWTHHIIIENKSEVDAELNEWIKEAYAFSMVK